MDPQPRRIRSSAVVGLALVAVGALLLVGQVLDIDLWGFVWPLFVLVPGVVLFVAMASGGASTAALAIPASIVTMTGLLLLYQSVTGHWESWAYAWSLIFPVSFGVGLIVAGRRSANESMRKAGEGMTRVGLIVFLVAGVFFELVLRISGGATARVFWPAMLVLAGLIMIVRQAGLGGRSGGRPTQAIIVPPPGGGETPAPARTEAGPAQE
ncbi:MAG: hypothetical protein A2Y93_14830 [Chloroflexi bacterium RBG_13_68_17]|nr:MAG: hypothetical protein A2Y93_14830 [Chloroflexi bacterium RBG_13_68_17]